MSARATGRFAVLLGLALALVVLARAGGALAATADEALIAAAGRGDTAAVRQLLAGMASVHVRDAAGQTALHAAAYGNHVEAARLLMQAGADVNVKDTVGRSTFMVAAVRGHLEILRHALAHGADVRILNQYGGTALIPASHYGHVEVVRELLKTPIDIDHVNRFGWTALIEAVILGDGGSRHTEIVRMLVNAGANQRIADPEGVTPLEHARRRGYREIVRILEAAADPKRAR